VKVRFTKGARRQFLAAIRYIAEDNPSAAERFRLRAEKRLRPLERFPHLGRRLPEFPELPHREVVLRPYRFFYRVHGATLLPRPWCHRLGCRRVAWRTDPEESGSRSTPYNKPMEPAALTLAVRHVPVASWAQRRATVAVPRSGRGSSANRWAARRNDQ
jgi:plasmid stabilization system protein ParE